MTDRAGKPIRGLDVVLFDAAKPAGFSTATGMTDGRGIADFKDIDILSKDLTFAIRGMGILEKTVRAVDGQIVETRAEGLI